mgnify:CR=1 FL=1
MKSEFDRYQALLDEELTAAGVPAWLARWSALDAELSEAASKLSTHADLHTDDDEVTNDPPADDPLALVVHLGMSGQLLVEAADAPAEDDLVRAVVLLLADWDWAERPVGVVAMPSRRRPQLVGSLAERLSTQPAPGDSTRSNLPSRSTTQACCCGTILKVRAMKMTARTARTAPKPTRKPAMAWPTPEITKNTSTLFIALIACTVTWSGSPAPIPIT